MVRYLLRVGYIGTKYRGTQKIQGFQNETIQDVIETALSSIRSKNIPCTYFASRTDKGVHAVMNALHVDLDHKISGEVYRPYEVKRKLNSYLTDNNHEIVITNACIVPEDFHARFHAKWRSYYYRVAVLKHGIKIPLKDDGHLGYLPPTEVNRCHIVSSELNTSLVKHVTDLYCGVHDFSAFTKYLSREPWKNTQRFIQECRFYETSYGGCINDPQYSNISMWEFYIQSKAFLYHQVRKLVAAALNVGFGQLSLSDVKSMLDNPSRENYFKGPLAPAGGLYLAHIHYDKEDLTASNIEKEEILDNEENSCIEEIKS